MGLFSVSKILVLMAIIVAVWYGFKIFSRRSQIGDQRKPDELGADKSRSADKTTQDMESCSVCGTFVPNGSAKNCGREACPYPD